MGQMIPLSRDPSRRLPRQGPARNRRTDTTSPHFAPTLGGDGTIQALGSPRQMRRFSGTPVRLADWRVAVEIRLPDRRGRVSGRRSRGRAAPTVSVMPRIQSDALPITAKTESRHYSATNYCTPSSSANARPSALHRSSAPIRPLSAMCRVAASQRFAVLANGGTPVIARVRPRCHRDGGTTQARRSGTRR